MGEPGPSDELSLLLTALGGETVRAVTALRDRWDAGDGDCSWCPLCQLATKLRGLAPDDVAKVAAAATALVAAVLELFPSAMD